MGDTGHSASVMKPVQLLVDSHRHERDSVSYSSDLSSVWMSPDMGDEGIQPCGEQSSGITHMIVSSSFFILVLFIYFMYVNVL